ncbi:MAG: hypothetical protein PHP74_04965 [Candidatus Gracilibacteria bacterium]|nr:hypothetical protein [Candidatus Gracilibacteria bacterium]
MAPKNPNSYSDNQTTSPEVKRFLEYRRKIKKENESKKNQKIKREALDNGRPATPEEITNVINRCSSEIRIAILTEFLKGNARATRASIKAACEYNPIGGNVGDLNSMLIRHGLIICAEDEIPYTNEDQELFLMAINNKKTE